MTIQEYIDWCAEWGNRHPDLRIGQHMFNTLEARHADIAAYIRGTYVDPFYDDKRIPEFLAFVQNFIDYD